MNDPTQQALTDARIHIAQLQMTVKYLTDGMGRMEERQEQMDAKVDQLLLHISEARGGWRTLMLVGGAASSLGGVVTWIVTHFAKASA